MTRVIKKLKLGIIKQDTETNPRRKTRIQFVRPKILFWTSNFALTIRLILVIEFEYFFNLG